MIAADHDRAGHDGPSTLPEWIGFVALGSLIMAAAGTVIGLALSLLSGDADHVVGRLVVFGLVAVVCGPLVVMHRRGRGVAAPHGSVESRVAVTVLAVVCGALAGWGLAWGIDHGRIPLAVASGLALALCIGGLVGAFAVGREQRS